MSFSLQIEVLEDRFAPAMVVAKPLSAAPATLMNTTPPAVMLPSDMTTQNGLAPAYMTSLAADLQSSAWTQVPHLAEDDDVRHFAQAIQSLLTASPKVSVAEAQAAAALSKSN